MGDFLLIIGERKALAWVVRERRMAFPERRATLASRLRRNDRLFVYTTRGCFHSPHQDRGRIVGEARVVSSAVTLDAPTAIAGIVCGMECEIELVSLARFRTGLELAPLVPELKVFPDRASWSARVRTVLLALPPEDGSLIRQRLADVVGAPSKFEDEYVVRAIGPRERPAMVP